MINKLEILKFFNDRAETWDDNNELAEKMVTPIINNFKKYINNAKVLDVGCGTGILTNKLLDAGAKEVYGIDLSPKMIKIAKAKHRDINNATFLCADILSLHVNKHFNLIMIYNAYPHLVRNIALVNKVKELTSSNAFLIVAHGGSKDHINNHHKAHAKKVSTILKPAAEEYKIWKPSFELVDYKDDESGYFFVCKKSN